MKLIVLDLARSIDETGLKEMFAPFGEVASATLVMDKVTGKSKGFGFIEMNDDEEATKAMTELTGKKISGQKIRVRVSTNAG